ncbi:hypothetical protein F4810DRAFT_291796 [Camillea tinctor]|nr:hypothetical protein F4810DRAFT_291796 [Camillea tinctor]
MAIGSVIVRDYHWSKNNYRVQSPNLDLRSNALNFIVRPLQGNNKDESWIVDPKLDLRDDIKSDAYLTEANGLFIPTTSDTGYFPVWVPVQGGNVERKGGNETFVVNLKTFEGLFVPVDKICWIPSHEASDDSGNLYTVIGTRKMGHNDTTICFSQQYGLPGQAKFELLPPSVLSACNKLDEARQQRLFEFQLEVKHMSHRVRGSVMAILSRIFVSPYRLNKGRRPLQAIFDERMNISRYIARCGGGDFLDAEVDDSDVDSTNDHPTTDRQEPANQRYTCGCKYLDLGPTYLTRYPPHTHIKDDECPLGSNHTKHCIFADHRPNHCVIPSSHEPHHHCPHFVSSCDPGSISSSSLLRRDVSTEPGTSESPSIATPSLNDSDMDAWQVELEDRGSDFSDAERLLRTRNTDIFDVMALGPGSYDSPFPDTPHSSMEDVDVEIGEGTSLINIIDEEINGLDNCSDVSVDQEAENMQRRVDIRPFSTPGPHDIEM